MDFNAHTSNDRKNGKLIFGINGQVTKSDLVAREGAMASRSISVSEATAPIEVGSQFIQLKLKAWELDSDRRAFAEMSCERTQLKSSCIRTGFYSVCVFTASFSR